MNLSKPSTVFRLLSLSLFSIAAIFTYVWYQNRIRSQVNMREVYEKFSLAEKETIPKFDNLNDLVAQGLPPLPSDSYLQKQISIGISAPLYEHGRWLRMEFATKQTPDFVIDYYSTFLINSDWQIDTTRHAFENLFYYKGTSCIEITPPSDKYSIYEILIWHDFRNQNFSPTIPEREILSWFEKGLSNFAECP